MASSSSSWMALDTSYQRVITMLGVGVEIRPRYLKTIASISSSRGPQARVGRSRQTRLRMCHHVFWLTRNVRRSSSQLWIRTTLGYVSWHQCSDTTSRTFNMTTTTRLFKLGIKPSTNLLERKWKSCLPMPRSKGGRMPTTYMAFEMKGDHALIIMEDEEHPMRMHMAWPMLLDSPLFKAHESDRKLFRGHYNRWINKVCGFNKKIDAQVITTEEK